MKAYQDTDRVKTGLKEAITLLCKTGLNFHTELSIDGLLGITLDHNEVFLVSIQEVIKNPGDFCVTSSSKLDREATQTDLFNSKSYEEQALRSTILSHAFTPKRSRRKRLLVKSPSIEGLEQSPASSLETEDDEDIYDQRKVQRISSFNELGDASSNEPLSLVVRKSNCDSEQNAQAEELHRQSTNDNGNSRPTDLSMRITAETKPDEIQPDILSQRNSITPSSANCDRQLPRDQKPKSNHRKSKSKPKRIIPVDENTDFDDDPVECSIQSLSPNPIPSQTSSPNDRLIVNMSNSDVKTEPKDEYDHVSSGYKQNSSTAVFTNVYDPGMTTSPSAHKMETPSSDREVETPGGISQVHPWGLMFDPDSHSKWLQSIAAYVQTPLNPASLLPHLSHQSLPFVGGPLSAVSISMPTLAKQQLSKTKDSASSSRSSTSFLPSPIKVPSAVPKLVHSRSTHMCSNCSTQKTTTWRRGDDGTPLCNACGLYLKLHKPVSSNLNTSQNSLRKVRDQMCSNCNTNVTTMWRRDTGGKPVCNACGLYYKLHQVNRPLTMVKTEIHSRRRKHKFGQFGSRMEPHSPGSQSTSASQLVTNNSGSPGSLNQSFSGYPDSPGFQSNKDGGDSFQSMDSMNSPEQIEEPRSQASVFPASTSANFYRDKLNTANQDKESDRGSVIDSDPLET